MDRNHRAGESRPKALISAAQAPMRERARTLLRSDAFEIPSNVFRYVLAESGWHQLVLVVLTISAFLLEVVPLELQRRIIDDVTKHRQYRLILWLCAAYLGTVLVQGGAKCLVNIDTRHVLGCAGYGNNRERRGLVRNSCMSEIPAEPGSK